MSTDEMHDILAEIGLTQRDFVAVIDKDERLIRRMAHGVEPIPGEIANLLRLILTVRRWRYSGQKPGFSKKPLDTNGF